MNRRLILLITTMVVIFSLMALYAPVQAQPKLVVTAKVRASLLRVRNGPGRRFARIGLLRRGDTVTVLGRNSPGSWLKIQTATGLVGWVGAGWIILSSRTRMSLPVVTASSKQPTMPQPSKPSY